MFGGTIWGRSAMNSSDDKQRNGNRGGGKRITLLLGLCTLVVGLYGLISDRLSDRDAAPSVAAHVSPPVEPGAKTERSFDTPPSAQLGNVGTGTPQVPATSVFADLNHDTERGLPKPAHRLSKSVTSAEHDAASELPYNQGGMTEESADDETPLSISGWVQDGGGKPLAGIQLVATARQLFGTAGDDKAVGEKNRQTARTDAEGYFRLSGLADGEYGISTVATPEYESAKATVRAGVDSTVLVVGGNTRISVTVSGTVAGSDGQPLAGVRVRAPGATGRASSGGDGRYALQLSIRDRNRSYSVQFATWGYRTESLRLERSALEDGAEIALDAAMEPSEDMTVVAGKLVDTAGTAIPDARIRLSSSRLNRSYVARSDRAGEFLFPEVGIGDDYRLWVRPQSGYEEYIEEPIVIATGGTHLPVTLEPLASGTLEGEMVAADGTPLPDFSLWLRVASPSEQQHRVVTSDRNGRFTVADLPQGELSFSTRASPHFRITGVQFAPEVRDRVQLWLDLGSYEARGYVLDADGEPLPGSRVSLTWSLIDGAVQSRSTRDTVTDAAGWFLFTQLGPGWHTLTVDAPGHRPARLDHYVSSGDDLAVRLQEDPS
jgi:protocatechuate 3,4-dioxygenase beta subunit